MYSQVREYFWKLNVKNYAERESRKNYRGHVIQESWAHIDVYHN